MSGRISRLTVPPRTGSADVSPPEIVRGLSTTLPPTFAPTQQETRKPTRIGWDELVDHRALTPDRRVQESRFGSGWAVIANFSRTEAFAAPDGTRVAPLAHHFQRWRSE